jgi:hypothetical protein
MENVLPTKLSLSLRKEYVGNEADRLRSIKRAGKARRKGRRLRRYCDKT